MDLETCTWLAALQCYCCCLLLLTFYVTVSCRSLGQNFCTDDRILANIVAAARVAPGDAVIEVGPGTGNLTRHLLSTKAHVLAVEKDDTLIERLRDELKQVSTCTCPMVWARMHLVPTVLPGWPGQRWPAVPGELTLQSSRCMGSIHLSWCTHPSMHAPRSLASRPSSAEVGARPAGDAASSCAGIGAALTSQQRCTAASPTDVFHVSDTVLLPVLFRLSVDCRRATCS